MATTLRAHAVLKADDMLTKPFKPLLRLMVIDVHPLHVRAVRAVMHNHTITLEVLTFWNCYVIYLMIPSIFDFNYARELERCRVQCLKSGEHRRVAVFPEIMEVRLRNNTRFEKIASPVI